MSDELDLAMQARMAEEDASRFREALWQAVFRNATRPSDETLIAMAVGHIEHARRMAPDNPAGELTDQQVVDVLAADLVEQVGFPPLEAANVAAQQYRTLLRVGALRSVRQEA